jgi:hypothetical protein
MAVLTLTFQIYVRSFQCVSAQDCVLSYGKAVAWSIIWPLSWAVYLIGLLLVSPPDFAVLKGLACFLFLLLGATLGLRPAFPRKGGHGPLVGARSLLMRT